MRTSAHILGSSLVALATLRRSPPSAALFVASSLAVDVDHYIWYAARFRRGNPLEAYGFCRAVQRDSALSLTLDRIENRRPLHNPLFSLLAVALGLRWPLFRPLAGGLALHLLLDWVDGRRSCRQARPYHPHQSPSGSTVDIQ